MAGDLLQGSDEPPSRKRCRSDGELGVNGDGGEGESSNSRVPGESTELSHVARLHPLSALRISFPEENSNSDLKIRNGIPTPTPTPHPHPDITRVGLLVHRIHNLAPPGEVLDTVHLSDSGNLNAQSHGEACATPHLTGDVGDPYPASETAGAASPHLRREISDNSHASHSMGSAPSHFHRDIGEDVSASERAVAASRDVCDTLAASENVDTARPISMRDVSEEVNVAISNLSRVVPPSENANVGTADQPVIVDVEDMESGEITGVGRGRGTSREQQQTDDPPNVADSASCPICMEPWTGDGTHRICCLSCGHLFGRSCITRWIKQGGKKKGKCPHCNCKAKLDDIRNLYVPFLTVLEGGRQHLLEELGVLQSKNQELSAENERLNKESKHLQGLLVSLSSEAHRGENGFLGAKNQRYIFSGEIKGLQKYYPSRQAPIKGNDMLFENCPVLHEARCREKSFFGGMNISNSDPSFGTWQHVNYAAFPPCGPHGAMETRAAYKSNFQLQGELPVQGARVFDMDAFSQLILVAQKSATFGDSCCLNKISLLSLAAAGVMPLPQGTGAVRDIRIAPSGSKLPGRLALVASLGKRVSLFSLESNNVVLTYNLQSPCWSCAWDLNDPNHIFVGLQDGSLALFDLRQTSSELALMSGSCRQPVHAIYPVCGSQGLRKNGILSACSSGVSFWDLTFGIQGCRPCSIPYVNNQGVCVALSYSQIENVAVSTFRPKSFLRDPAVSVGSQPIEAAGSSTQVGTQLNLGSRPLRAAHVPMVFASVSEAETTCLPEISSSSNTSFGTTNLDCKWKFGKPMFGPVSPVGMHRSAIISGRSPELRNLFAFGDEGTRALMLWDTKTLTVTESLKPHRTPILDVKSVNSRDELLLGCASMSAFQIYRAGGYE